MPAKLRFYEPGTAFSTPKTVYTTSALNVAHDFPILSDSAGRWPAIWGEHDELYDVAWSDLANDALQDAWEDLSPGLSGGRFGPIIIDATDLGAVGDGVTDDTEALQAGLADGQYLWVGEGLTFKITESLIVPSNSGIIGDGTATIYMPSASFSNTSLASAQRYGSDAVGINVSGLKTAPYTPNTNIVLRGFTLQSQVSAGRVLRGIAAQNVTGLVIEEVEVFGLPVGVAIAAASVTGNSRIQRNYIHTCTDNTNWGGAPASPPQITAIEIDNDLVNSVPSASLLISENRIKDLTVGATFIAAHGYQTDGINIANRLSTDHIVTANDIDTVGEGIDTFGRYSLIQGNSIRNAYIYGLKFIHGASYNTATGNHIRRAGLAGIVVSGSTAVGAGDTDGNRIGPNDIDEIDPNGVWVANDTACIAIIDNVGTTGKPKNTHCTGGRLNEGANGKNGWLDSSTGSGGNYGEALDIIVGAANSRRVLVSGGAGSVSLSGSLEIRRTNLV